MKNLKLKFNILPRGAWNNDLSKTLSKKDWDKLRDYALKKAKHKCEVCGYNTDELDVHEVWEFNENEKTQTLINLEAICTKCHGVKHFKNSVRLGYAKQAKIHFMNINKCSELEFAAYLFDEIEKYKKLNKVYRWKVIANLEKFDCKDIKINYKKFPIIVNPYEKLNWNYDPQISNKLFITNYKEGLIGSPKICFISVDNYQGEIYISALFCNKIEWFLDGVKIETKYNVSGKFNTKFSVKNISGKKLNFKMYNDYGTLVSQNFILKNNY